MAFKFVVLCSMLAVASAGIIAEPSYTSYSAPIVQKTLVQPAVAYAASPAHSASYTKTLSYTAPKAAIVAAPAVETYSHYEPQYHQPSHAVIATPHYEHGHSEQNIVRSAHGTVSQISKSVDTPTSSVRKYVNTNVNDGYKTVSYAAPATTYVQQPAVLAKTAVVSQPISYAAPAASYVHSQPASYVHSQPASYVHSQPATYVHQQPAVLASKTFVSQPIAQVSQPVYAQHAPVLATKVSYSPAVEVAHVNFESPIAHYGW